MHVSSRCERKHSNANAGCKRLRLLLWWWMGFSAGGHWDVLPSLRHLVSHIFWFGSDPGLGFPWSRAVWILRVHPHVWSWRNIFNCMTSVTGNSPVWNMQQNWCFNFDFSFSVFQKSKDSNCPLKFIYSFTTSRFSQLIKQIWLETLIFDCFSSNY